MLATLFNSITGLTLLVGIGFLLVGTVLVSTVGLIGISPTLCGLALIGLSINAVIKGYR